MAKKKREIKKIEKNIDSMPAIAKAAYKRLEKIEAEKNSPKKKSFIELLFPSNTTISAVIAVGISMAVYFYCIKNNIAKNNLIIAALVFVNCFYAAVMNYLVRRENNLIAKICSVILIACAILGIVLYFS